MKIINWGKRCLFLDASLIISFIAGWFINNYNDEINFIALIFICVLLFGAFYAILDSWFSKSKERHIIILTGFMVIILVFQLIVMANQTRINALQIGIFEKQTELFDRQTEILNNSSPPYEPWIKIIPDKDDLIVFASDFVSDFFMARIDFTIYNHGSTDSQRIECNADLTNENLFAYFKKTKEDDFKNIPAGTSIKTELYIKNQECQKDSLRLCYDEDLIPLGNQNITLNCKCSGCNKQKEFSENFEIKIV
ncbi:MAG: hypothetical protein AABY22_22540 [Nanoarchaeota archaeon]